MRKQQAKRKYWIKRLVKLTTFLDDQSIADILLVWSGFKPAALIELSYLPGTTASRSEFHKAVRDLKKILQKLALRHQLYLNYPKNPWALTRYSYVAKNRKTFKKLIAADMEKNAGKRRRQLGMLLGYPKTAIHSFANSKALDRHKTPPPILKMKETKFLNFRISRYWKKELKYVQKRAREIKKISPELYQRITN